MPYTTSRPAEETSTTAHYAVRVGMHGQIGRFFSGGHRYRRGLQVICRTARGLEVGQVLGALQWVGEDAADQFDGRIVRAMAAEDQLLWNHLKQLAEDAHAACQAWLDDSGLGDRLLDVEPLLDASTLYFHFLDQVSPETEQHIEHLVEIFQSTVAGSAFAQLLEKGCGPGCGTDKAKGCGSACVSCVTRCGVADKKIG